MIRTIRRSAGWAMLLAPLVTSLRADTTVRYRTDIQSSSLVPAGTLDDALGGRRDIVIQIKGSKTHSTVGNLASIRDLTSQDMTLVDEAHKRFVTVPASQYAEQLKAAVQAVPNLDRNVLASLKSNLESRDTGRTADIQGIQAEEHEFVLTIYMGAQDGPPEGTPLIKMTTQAWTAKPGESQRVPGLAEFTKYRTTAGAAGNPVETIKQFLSVLPGIGDSLGAMVEQMTKNGTVSLRTRTEIVMPFLAIMSQQVPVQPGGRGLPAGLNPNAPLMQMTQEVVEFSNDPLDDGIFQVPGDYEKTTLEEILKGAASAAPPPQFKK